MDHGSEGSSAPQFGRCPGVPVADGGEWAVEVALVHGPWYAWVAGTGGVRPVPEETALFDYHCGHDCDVIVEGGLASRTKRQVQAQLIAIIRAGNFSPFLERFQVRCEETDNRSYSISSNRIASSMCG